ncbi:MAG TPA: hypothetical protein GX401_03900 [Clostridiales bacterium]|nr:hypothetical protein [Clostridiales bacterium]
MNSNSELLNFVYQNSQMGVNTITQLLPMVEQTDLQEQLKSQLTEYQDIHQRAQQMLNDSGIDEKGLSAMEKMKTYLMVNMQTMTDHSASHIAEMLVLGSNMGIVQSIKKSREYKADAKPESLSLMKELGKMEENNVKKLKEFL